VIGISFDLKFMEHVIKNFDLLATSSLRRQALRIVEAGFAAIDTKTAVNRTVKYNQQKEILKVDGKSYPLADFERVICVGFGKAAFNAVSELQNILGDKIKCGFVIDLKEGNLGNITCKIGTHPYPTKINIDATKELVAMLSNCTEKDLVLCVVSGGGSALLCSPHDMSCEQEVSIIAALTVKGASIQELNIVRKHISTVKGGNLAKMMYPASCISLIFSDVPGDDLDMVASGPTVMDKTFMKDAAAVLKKYNVLEICELPSCNLTETPKEPKYFEKVQNVLAVSSKQALDAMKEEAENLGFDVKIFSDNFQGIAREIGPKIVAQNQKHQALLGAGESTVEIKGKGKGGRNQEMALAALSSVVENQVLVCAASDGHDNTDCAGAIIDRETLAKAKNLGLDINVFLDDNDSFNFFEKTDNLLLTGHTEANVADFFVCLRQ
jgi:glycerate 2-kinase